MCWLSVAVAVVDGVLGWLAFHASKGFSTLANTARQIFRKECWRSPVGSPQGCYIDDLGSNRVKTRVEMPVDFTTTQW